MKTLLLVLLGALGALGSATPSLGQYAAFKSDDGILLISQRPGQYFSVDLPGAKIVPVGQKQATHPSFMVFDSAKAKPEEGRFIQVMPVPLAEFKANPSQTDEAILRRQAEYEIQYWHPSRSDLRPTKLAQGRVGLVWRLSLAQKKKEQLFLSFRPGNYVLVLSSNLPNDREAKAVENYLRRVAGSFRASAHPLPTPQPPSAAR